MCEHYIAHCLCSDFPDWSIAASGSEAGLRIGYEYAHFVSNQEQQLDPNSLGPESVDDQVRAEER